ncbi:MAG: hypothetical protein VX107_03365 [Pseudomonadota bacterium]|nr:hypothetical protein [Pseudomonadota bacterium]
MVAEGKTWIAHYVFASVDSEMRSAMQSIVAPTYETAMEAAAKLAPSEEFVVSIHEESEDQFLGSVRNQAASLSDQTIDPETLEVIHDDEEEADRL